MSIVVVRRIALGKFHPNRTIHRLPRSSIYQNNHIKSFFTLIALLENAHQEKCCKTSKVRFRNWGHITNGLKSEMKILILLLGTEELPKGYVKNSNPPNATMPEGPSSMSSLLPKIQIRHYSPKS